MPTSFRAKNFMTTTVVMFSPHMDVTDAIHELVSGVVALFQSPRGSRALLSGRY